MKHHGAGLHKLTGNEDLVAQMTRNYKTAELSVPDRAMLDYAVKLTEAPWTMEQGDIEELRKHRFSEAAILDINQVASYYAFVNRLADGLGVELEPHWEQAG
ncbi:MAG: peroxidase [Chloroflexi bacterium]|nr:peroxidase [Chloroflexota bacterium]